MAMPLAKKAVAPLVTGALSGLASLGVDKIFGKGQRGGFLIPQDKIAQLIAYKHVVSAGQKKDILSVFQQAVKKWCIHQEKYKKEIVSCAVIGAYIIFWRDEKVDHY